MRTLAYVCDATKADRSARINEIGRHGLRSEANYEDAPGSRKALEQAIEALDAQSVLAVTDLMQLGNTMEDVLVTMAAVRKRGAWLTVARENATTMGVNMADRIFGVIERAAQEFQRRKKEQALARGRKGGRPPKIDEAARAEVRDLYRRGEMTVSGIARKLQVSRTTVYGYLGGVKKEVDGEATGERAEAPRDRPAQGLLPDDNMKGPAQRTGEQRATPPGDVDWPGINVRATR